MERRGCPFVCPACAARCVWQGALRHGCGEEDGGVRKQQRAQWAAGQEGGHRRLRRGHLA
eukprot:1178622-Prorocentrum_minimum.AAC.3